MTFGFMLASPHTKLAPTVPQALQLLEDMGTDVWTVEEKLDGLRCLAVATRSGPIHLFTRNERDISAQFPEIVNGLRAAHPSTSFTLDGEIITSREEGVGFGTVVGRMHMTPKRAARAALDIPATFVAFDLLMQSGDEFHDEPQYSRRAKLHWLYRERSEESSSYDTILSNQNLSYAPLGAKDFWCVAVETDGAEGLIAKRRSSTYRAGRSPNWVKLKLSRRASVIVIGFEEGEGSRRGRIGALYMAVLDGTEIVPCGKVGTGFNDRDLDQLWAIYHQGQPFLIEVEYQSVGADHKLRFPSYKGLRSDLDVHDATLSQLTLQGAP